MLEALNALTLLQFVILVLAVGTTLIQLFLLIGVAVHANYCRLHWGIAAVVLWIAFFAVTR